MFLILVCCLLVITILLVAYYIAFRPACPARARGDDIQISQAAGLSLTVNRNGGPGLQDP